MPDPIETRVLEELQRLGVPHEAISCDPDLADTVAFCARYGYDLADSANAILIASKRPAGRYALCMVLANTRLDANRRVRDMMEVKKLSFASAEVTKEVTGMLLGGVTPFGLPGDLPVYVDSRVMERDRVIVGGGSRSLKLRLSPDVFRRLPRAEIVMDLAVSAG